MVDANIFGGGESAGWLSWKSDAKEWDVDGNKCQVSKILIDPQSIKTGWGHVERGQRPDFVWAEVAGTTMQRPSDKHKAAFEVQAYVSSKYGAPVDGVRPWRSNGAANLMAIKAIWRELATAAKDNPGKWAVISVTGSEMRETKFKPISVPVLKVDGFAPAPAAMAAPPPPPAPVAPAVEEDVVF